MNTPAKAEILSLRKSLRDAMRRRACDVRALVEELDGVTECWARVRSKLKAARAEIVMLEASIRDLDEITAGLRAKVSSLENEIENRKADEAALRAENQKLRAKVAELSAPSTITTPGSVASSIPWSMTPQKLDQFTPPVSEQASSGPL